MQSASRVQIVHDLYAPHCHSYHMDGSCYLESIKLSPDDLILPMIAAELGRCFKQFPGSESLPPSSIVFLTGHLKVLKNSQQKKVITTNHMKYGLLNLLNIHVRSCDPQQKKEYTL